LVTAREDGVGEKRLVGYLVPKNGPVPVVELRDFIRTKLPLHMVPAQFVMLEQFPLTPNGKIDLRRLPAPEDDLQPAKNHVPPRDAEEQSLAEIWQEVLMLKQVSADDNFFELGGDSLSATRAFARINKQFSMNITLREMFEHPTIAALAAIVRKQKGSSSTRSQPIPRQPRVLQATG
jgi:acyl carrier protein